jgi:hypothetical protein
MSESLRQPKDANMSEDLRRQIEESRLLTEQAWRSIEWLKVNMAHSNKLIAESNRLLEIADFAIDRTVILLASNLVGRRS